MIRWSGRDFCWNGAWKGGIRFPARRLRLWGIPSISCCAHLPAFENSVSFFVAFGVPARSVSRTAFSVRAYTLRTWGEECVIEAGSCSRGTKTEETV